MLMQAVQTLQLQSHVQALALLISIPVAVGKKAEQGDKVLFVKLNRESGKRSTNAEIIATCYQVVSRSQ